MNEAFAEKMWSETDIEQFDAVIESYDTSVSFEEESSSTTAKNQ